jgi:hypothetical protein
VETYVLVAGNDLLETLALAHLGDDLTGLGGGVQRGATRNDSPVIEHGLGEGLATGGGAEIGGETEGLVDGQVSLDVEQRSSGALLLGVDVTTAAGEDTVDTTHSLLGNLDLDVEDGLEKTGVSKHGSGVQDTTSGGDKLATTTVNSISVEGNILIYCVSWWILLGGRCDGGCELTRMFQRTERMGSSATGPSRVAHWKPETTESLISFRY